jgi:hypothetical protein
MPEGKRKLTLTVDSETVDAAKNLGLNISEVTEELLKLHTFDPKLLEAGPGREEYGKLLASMDSLLNKYRCSVLVGSLEPYEPELHEGEKRNPVYYHGAEVADTSAAPITDFAKSDSLETIGGDDYYVDYLKPDQILKNFLKAIQRAKDSRAEEADSLVFAMKMVEALTEAESNRASRSRPQEGSGSQQ